MASPGMARRRIRGERTESLVNDSDYGLGACICALDAVRPIHASRQLDGRPDSITGWTSLQAEYGEWGTKSGGMDGLGAVAPLDVLTRLAGTNRDFAPRKAA